VGAVVAGEREVVAVSATDRRTLPPLLENIGQMLSQDLGLNKAIDLDLARNSRIA